MPHQAASPQLLATIRLELVMGRPSIEQLLQPAAAVALLKSLFKDGNKMLPASQGKERFHYQAHEHEGRRSLLVKSCG